MLLFFATFKYETFYGNNKYLAYRETQIQIRNLWQNYKISYNIQFKQLSYFMNYIKKKLGKTNCLRSNYCQCENSRINYN